MAKVHLWPVRLLGGAGHSLTTDIMTSVRTIAAVSTSTIAASLVGYCFYFDYKRRNDPEFRKALGALKTNFTPSPTGLRQL